jgi:hypothetical protein
MIVVSIKVKNFVVNMDLSNIISIVLGVDFKFAVLIAIVEVTMEMSCLFIVVSDENVVVKMVLFNIISIVISVDCLQGTFSHS